MKVVLHGFGTFPVFFYHLIKHSKQSNSGIEWYILLSTPHFQEAFEQLLGPDNVRVIDTRFSEARKQKAIVDAVSYPQKLAEDIAAEKRPTLNVTAVDYENKAKWMFHQAREFMSDVRANVALVSQVEGMDGKIFIRAAQSLGIEVAVPTGLRNVGGIYFSPDECESFPEYANEGAEQYREEAERFIRQFNEKPMPAWSALGNADEPTLDTLRAPFTKRLINFVKYALADGSSFKLDKIRVAFLNNLPMLRNAIWRLNTKRNSRLCNIESVNELPEKFIFFPLQYTPESSINTPAAYFLDQMRAVDALRFSMPSDYTLVVKEHPACIETRGGGLLRQLLKTPGVRVAKYNLNTAEVCAKADLVVSVTGTVVMEAFMLGKASMSLAKALPSEVIGGVVGLCNLSETLGVLLSPDYKISEEAKVEALAKVFNIQTKAVFTGPGIPGEPALKQSNIVRFFDGFVEHCKKQGIQCDC
ncbi:hypothetical protein [Enterovibrio paralichthyis]|uniref:hypothetical protein n=1 Tax=Enterovibrio paralichthyis TaxID=2853805 RepID=UPI001C44E7DC|nr:hypothetical protein [Enterovibrio paralichthyis]MBV7298634.1 hypothetical protein [Enterovibrio paralichthyis]